MHTPTPELWTLRRIYSNGCEVCPRIESPNRWIADVVGAPHLGFTDTIVIGERIVADHNAMLGIANVAEFRAAVEELLQYANTATHTPSVAVRWSELVQPIIQRIASHLPAMPENANG